MGTIFGEPDALPNSDPPFRCYLTKSAITDSLHRDAAMYRT